MKIYDHMILISQDISEYSEVATGIQSSSTLESYHPILPPIPTILTQSLELQVLSKLRPVLHQVWHRTFNELGKFRSCLSFSIHKAQTTYN